MGLKTSPCKGCPATVVWGRTPGGKDIPLDIRKTSKVYQLVTTEGAPDMAYPVVGDFYVTHFATCPRAGAFSKSHRKLPEVGSVNELLLHLRKAEARAATKWKTLQEAVQKDDLLAFLEILFGGAGA